VAYSGESFADAATLPTLWPTGLFRPRDMTMKQSCKRIVFETLINHATLLHRLPSPVSVPGDLTKPLGFRCFRIDFKSTWVKLTTLLAYSYSNGQSQAKRPTLSNASSTGTLQVAQRKPSSISTAELLTIIMHNSHHSRHNALSFEDHTLRTESLARHRFRSILDFCTNADRHI